MVNGKDIVCKLCNRHFKSDFALNQHRLDRHSAPMPRPATKVARQKKRSTRSGGNGASVSEPMRVIGKTADTAKLSGVDRVASIADVNGKASGTVLVQTSVSPGIFARLKLVAQAFQRIKYVSLRFRIEPQISTATSGGYVAAFIRDPSDRLPEKELLTYLTSQQGSQTTKWWQSTVVNANNINNRLYYTSEGVEIREYSPGTLVVAVDGAATQSGNLTVFCDWSVELSSASLETAAAVAVGPVTIQHDLFLRTDSANPKDASLWTKNTDGSWWAAPIADIIPGAVEGAAWKLPFPVTVSQTDTVTRICWFVKAVSAVTLKPAMESENDILSSNDDEVMFLRKGTVLEMLKKPSGFHDVVSASRSVKSTTETYPSSEDKFSSFLQKFETVLETLTNVMSVVASSSRVMPLDLSMDCQQRSRQSSISLVEVGEVDSDSKP